MAEKEKQRSDKTKKDHRPVQKKATKKKKIPLWLKIARVLYAFFSFLGEKIKKGVIFVAAFLYDFFSGLPDGVRYLYRTRKEKRRKKKAIAKAEKEHRKAMRQAAISHNNAPKKRNKKRKRTAENALLYDPENDFQNEENRAKFLTPQTALRCGLGVLSLLFVAEMAVFIHIGVRKMEKNDVADRPALTMTVVEGEKKTNVKIPAEAAYPYGGETAFFDLTALAEQLSVNTVGNEKTAYYTLPNGKQMKILFGSNRLEINGSIVLVNDAIYYYKGKVYAPLALLTEYVDGLIVSYSEEDRTVILKRKPGAEYTEKNPVFEEIDFNTRAIEGVPLPVVKESK